MLNDRDFQSLLGMLPFREHISPAVADSLRTHSTIKDWYAGEKISDLGRTGIGMIAFLSGRARISLVSASAHQVTISVSRREDVIYIGGNPSPQVLNNYELEAEVDVRAIIVPLSDFETMLHSDLRIENTVLRSVLGIKHHGEG